MSLPVYLVWSLLLFNGYVYILIPEYVIQELWKWDIFMILLFAPLVWNLRKSKL